MTLTKWPRKTVCTRCLLLNARTLKCGTCHCERVFTILNRKDFPRSEWKIARFIKLCVKMCFVVNNLNIISYLCSIIVMMAQAVWANAWQRKLISIGSEGLYCKDIVGRKRYCIWFGSDSQVRRSLPMTIDIHTMNRKRRGYACMGVSVCAYFIVWGNCGRDAWTSEYERRVRFLYVLR